MNDTISTYIWPGQTDFGLGAAQRVGAAAHELEATAVFIVTDPGILQAGLLSPVEIALEKSGLPFTIYDQIPANPDIDSVDLAAAAFRASNADIIVGLGGGSVLDAAKGVRLQAGGPAEASIGDYALTLGANALPAPPNRTLPPMIAIPTTAGTGSEVTPWGVLTNLQQQSKFGIGGPRLLPNIALVDPELTLTLPPFLTAATGMDALTHLVEAYVSTNSGPAALDPLILYGIELIGRSLHTAVQEPDNRAARYDVMLASVLGGIAISSRWLGACHSLAHPLSSLAELHHGAACALMLPYQVSFSLSGAPERYGRIAHALDPQQTASLAPSARADWAVSLLHQLNLDLQLPTRLRDAGVAETLLSPLAEHAYRDTNWMTNPRPVTQADLAQLYREAY